MGDPSEQAPVQLPVCLHHNLCSTLRNVSPPALDLGTGNANYLVNLLALLSTLLYFSLQNSCPLPNCSAKCIPGGNRDLSTYPGGSQASFPNSCSQCVVFIAQGHIKEIIFHLFRKKIPFTFFWGGEREDISLLNAKRISFSIMLKFPTDN